MNETLAAAIITSVIGVFGVLTAPFLVHRLTLKREDRSDRRVLEREAAHSLCESLHGLSLLVERSEVNAVSAPEIVEAVAVWEAAYRRNETLLRSSWRHVRRSVASALGEHFGAVGASNIFPVPEGYPVADYDAVWWDRACSYLQYVAHQLSRWGDSPMRARGITIRDFDTWLSQRR